MRAAKLSLLIMWSRHFEILIGERSDKTKLIDNVRADAWVVHSWDT
jgi:hypothetical protein